MATFETYPVINPYARLGLRPGAPLAEVKRAYRRLAMEHHRGLGRQPFESDVTQRIRYW